MILVVVEHTSAVLKPNTIELLAFARRIGSDFGMPTAAVILGSDSSKLAEELQKQKVDRIFVAADASLDGYDPDKYVHALQSIIAAEKPFIVATPHSVRGIDFMPRLAVSLRKAFVAGCVAYEKIGNRLLLTRQIFNAKMNMKVEPRGEPPYFVTLSPGAFSA